MRHDMTARYEQVGREILRLRTDKGWSYEDMSTEILRAFGIKYATSAYTIYRAERGERIRIRHQFAIARVLGHMPTDWWGADPVRMRERAGADA